MHNPDENSSQKIDEQLRNLKPVDQLRFFINASKNVVQRAIKTDTNYLEALQKNPKQFVLDETKESPESWDSIPDDEKKWTLRLFEDQICLNLFAKKSDLEQLDYCLEMIKINMPYASQMYNEINNKILGDKPNINKLLADIKSTRSFLDRLSSPHCGNIADQDDIETLEILGNAYRNNLGKEPPFEWLIRGNPEFKAIVMKLYSSRLSEYVTTLKFKLDYPQTDSDIMKDNVEELKAVVDANKIYVKDEIYERKSFLSQLSKGVTDFFKPQPEEKNISLPDDSKDTKPFKPFG